MRARQKRRQIDSFPNEGAIIVKRTALRIGAWMLAAAALPVGCASIDGSRPMAANAAAERGGTVAQIHCAACHAIGPTGESRSAMAPPFRVIRARYNQITFERRLERLASERHSEMPSFSLDRADIDAVAAYIETLVAR
jgi:cytochrome c